MIGLVLAAALAWAPGEWRGEAWRSADGKRQELIQTERVTRDGAALVFEGHAFERDGRPTALNAVGWLTYDPTRKAYSFETTAIPGRYPASVTANGWSWSMPAGRSVIRFTSTYKAGVWREVGEAVGDDGAATPIFEMKLKRKP